MDRKERRWWEGVVGREGKEGASWHDGVPCRLLLLALGTRSAVACCGCCAVDGLPVCLLSPVCCLVCLATLAVCGWLGPVWSFRPFNPHYLSPSNVDGWDWTGWSDSVGSSRASVSLVLWSSLPLASHLLLDCSLTSRITAH